MASGPTPSVNLFCSTGNSSLRYEQQNASNLLPIDRWASATASLHTDFGGGAFGLGLNDLAQRIQRNGIETGSLAAGNALWKAGTDMTAASVDFCFGDSLGYTVDHYAAVLGNAIVSSGIIALLVALAIVAFFWRLARRGEVTWRRLGRTVLVTGVFATMIAGASASTPTSFGAFSPGWLITTVYSTMSGIASLPTMAIAQAADKSLTGVTPQAPDLLGCTDYTDQLLRNYKSDYGPSVAAQAAASVPMALDAMWEQTGLRAYQDIQFGQQAPGPESTSQVAVNDYGLRTYCRALEANVGIPAVNQVALTKAGTGEHLPPGSNPSSAAWLTPGDSNSIIDASVVAWAACKYTASGWSVSPEFHVLSGGHRVTRQDCNTWWSTPASSWSPSAFHWPTSTNTINNDTANSPQVADFLLNWHGDANGQAIATAITFLPASIAVFAVFLLLAGALIIAKMALLVLIVILPIVLALSLIPGPRWEGAATKVAKYALGLMVFGVMAQLILSLVAVISSFLVQAGAALFSPGSAMTILWTALAPFAAVWLMHHLFKAIGAPSPFKLNGALGWAAAAGGVGIGIGEALHNRTVGKATGSLKTAGLNAPKSAMRFVTKPSTRVGGLQPGAPVGAGVGATRKGLAAGGAVGAATAAASSMASQSAGAAASGTSTANTNGAGTQAPGWSSGTTGAEAPFGGPNADGSDAATNIPSNNSATNEQATKRIWLNVPQDEGNEAKAAGAKWDASAKSWYVSAQGPDDLNGLERWAPDLSPKPVTLSEHVRSGGEIPSAVPTVSASEKREAARYYQEVVAGQRPDKKPIRGQGVVGGAAAFATNRAQGSLYRAKVGYKLPAEAVKERWREARARFAQAPLRSTARVAGKAALIGGAVLATPVSAGISAGVVGGIIAARHARRAHLEHPARKAFAEHQRVEAWRSAQAARAEQDSKERAAQQVAPAPEQEPKPNPKPTGGPVGDQNIPASSPDSGGGPGGGNPGNDSPPDGGSPGNGGPPPSAGPSPDAGVATPASVATTPEPAVVGASAPPGVSFGPTERQPSAPQRPLATSAQPASSARSSTELSPEELWHRRAVPVDAPRRGAGIGHTAEDPQAAEPVAAVHETAVVGAPAPPGATSTGPVPSSPASAQQRPTPTLRSPVVTGSSQPASSSQSSTRPALDELWRPQPASSKSVPTAIPTIAVAESRTGPSRAASAPATSRPPRPPKLSPETVRERMREARERWRQAPVRSSLASIAQTGTTRPAPVAASIATGLSGGIAAARAARRAYASNPAQAPSWSDLYRRARDIASTSRPSTGHEQQSTP